jgi:cytoplasmic iron level regulating protein YaaA (DUF328/UPF0246 family)
MLILLSPAKNLDTAPAPVSIPGSVPTLLDETRALLKTTAKLKRADLKRLMHISDALADLNYQRFQAFSDADKPEGAKQAALIFNGDTYQGLDAKSLSEADLAFAQDHVRILSGLYGVLRPLDLIQPYRLEMGTRLHTRRGETLYDFWGDKIAKALNAQMTGEQVVINCASTEYASAVKAKALKGQLITPVFQEIKDGKARVLGFFAKRARGMMARYAIDKRITDAEPLKGFDYGGYRFDAQASSADKWVFARPQPDPVGG